MEEARFISPRYVAVYPLSLFRFGINYVSRCGEILCFVSVNYDRIYSAVYIDRRRATVTAIFAGSPAMATFLRRSGY